MGFVLRSGLSFCMVGDRAIFLDVPRDRYFCLADSIQQDLIELVAGRPVQPCGRQRLIDLKLIVEAPGAGVPQPCASPRHREDGLLDGTPQGLQANIFELSRAFLALGTTSVHLKLFGFASVIAAFYRHKARVTAGSLPKRRVDTIVRAFQDTRYLVTEQDRCLVRSIAIGRELLAAGAAPDVILAVKLQPFRAHCWVQLGEVLVNDRHDFVRDYTPILVL